MLVNRIYINLIIRTTLITLTSVLFAFSIFRFSDLLISINLALLIILQLFLLIRKVNLVNYELANFFNSIKYDDSSLVIKDKQKWKSHSRLTDAVKQLNNKIREIKLHDAASEAYFKNLVEHIDIGVLSLDENGKIDICNTAFKEILGLDSELTTSSIRTGSPTLFKLFTNILPGEKKLLNLHINRDVLHLSIHATTFPLLKKKMKLISIQDIKTELDDRELETWQKMIRVLTHEIMNSISPVSSTINTIRDLLTGIDNTTPLQVQDLSNNLIGDTVKGLEIINERSAGLKDFVQKFRSLTLLPDPDLQIINSSELFNEIGVLMHGSLEEYNIRLIIDEKAEDIKINADKKLMHQVLINLVNNAIDAMSRTNTPSIKMNARKINGKIFIEVSDNGQGIQPENIENIFTPFFTTRDEGSGIGLSISKQIMRLHGGDITVRSSPGKITTFRLEFNS